MKHSEICKAAADRILRKLNDYSCCAIWDAVWRDNPKSTHRERSSDSPICQAHAKLHDQQPWWNRSTSRDPGDDQQCRHAALLETAAYFEAEESK